MITLRKIASIVGGKVIGAPEQTISGVSDIREGAPDTITFLFNPRQKDLITKTRASAIIVSDESLLEGRSGIVANNSRLAMAKVLELFQDKASPAGIHSTTVIPDTIKLGKNVSIGAFTVIGVNVKIDDNAVIYNNVSIGNNVHIGANTAIFSNVSISSNVKIGKTVSIEMGSVIGSKGFGYETVEGVHHTIPQIGSVILEDDVDIGSNCTIDRGTIGNTVVGKGTKIDNLVQVAHNVKIGKGCLIAGQVGIAGSAQIGEYCIFGGQVGVKDGITIGDRAIFVAKTGVSKSVPGGKVYAGMPCREIRETNKRDATYTQVQALKKRFKVLEEKLAK